MATSPPSDRTDEPRGDGRPLRRGPHRRPGGPGRVARPPGPPGALLYAGLALHREPPAYFLRIARRHPRLAHLRLGGEHVYVLSHPDLVHELFVTRGRDLRKGRTLERIRMLLGEGLLTSEGEWHRSQRRLVQPALQGDRLRAYAPVMVRAARDRAAGWRDGLQVDLAREMSALTVAVVGEALFGTDLRDRSDEVADALGELMDGFSRRMLPGADLLLSVPSRGRARLFAAVDRLDALVRGMIAERRRRPLGSDLLSTLLEASADDGTAVRDEVMTLLLAGHETTASALSWTWWLLDRNPEAAAWLRAEVDAVAADPARLTYADLDRLPRTRAVLAEAMRLYPPSWILGRRTLADVELDGWTLPAGSLCVTSQYALHRDPRFWAAPDAFAPARWIGRDGAFGEGVPGQPRAAYLPFGVGARICVGLGFAWTEGVLVLATLARRWAPQVAPGHRVRPQAAVTLRPNGGMPVVLHERSPGTGRHHGERGSSGPR
ncbi:cytochrome P450 [Actinopolymorpha singaporensis]|uniref:Cytochrome P450 n=1 Tax=Actinopolymorpha singaporensis TaxID=117157 RepID=A0A1H1YZ52_9ACTN|nr:cytochrome P450 [Actinopolymorpha singaporensis]SDT26619.1 Cytochrome P450 [Actinopolymorpha singaporensis]